MVKEYKISFISPKTGKKQHYTYQRRKDAEFLKSFLFNWNMKAEIKTIERHV